MSNAGSRPDREGFMHKTILNWLAVGFLIGLTLVFTYAQQYFLVCLLLMTSVYLMHGISDRACLPQRDELRNWRGVFKSRWFLFSLIYALFCYVVFLP